MNTELKVILNNDEEYQRLVTLFDSAYNGNYLSVLKSVLSTGISSKLIKSLNDLRFFSYMKQMGDIL